RKKVKRALSDEEDAVEYLLSKKLSKKKASSLAGSFDLNLCPHSTSSEELKIQPYSIFLGKGVGVEIKEFRKAYYIAFSKTVDGDVRNRFNLPLDQLPILSKAVEALTEYIKDQPSNSDRKKVKRALSDEEDAVEYLLSKKLSKKKASSLAGSFDLNLCPHSTSSEELKIQPYSIFLGKGVGVEIKEFRKAYYIAFSKTVDGDVRNRFNLPLDQLPILSKAVEALTEYIKDQPSNSGI
ncbi:hypothetical protein AVEN_151777-1, partial [Araneus ventricosus]